MKYLSIFFLILFVPGCALIHSYSDNLPEKIETWTQQKEYKLALDTISYIKKSHKDYSRIQKQKAIILQKSAQHKKHVITESTNLADAGKWLAAFSLIDSAEKQLPDSSNLRKHRDTLTKKRDVILQSYRNLLLTTHARKLASDLPIYENISKILSEEEAKAFQLTEYNQLRKQISAELTERCEQQYRHGKYIQALATIELAMQLQPEKLFTKRLNQIKQQIDGDIDRKKFLQVSRIKSLIAKLQQGYSHEILKQANIMLDWLEDNKTEKDDYNILISTLKEHIDRGISQYIEAARKLYSKGKIKEALDIWKDLYILNPQHPKLLSHINRAEKVLDKLNKLRKK